VETVRMTAQDETSDIQAASEGDVAAFERLYRSNVGRVFAVCLRMTGSRAAAEERTQDTFVRAWENLSTFRGESAFSSWLHRLAVNSVLMESRADGRRRRHIVAAEDLDRAAPEKRRTFDHRLDLEEALRLLPEGARRVFLLHDVHGYRHEEIAEMMGVTTGTSKAQLHRSRKLLREVLR